MERRRSEGQHPCASPGELYSALHSHLPASVATEDLEEAFFEGAEDDAETLDGTEDLELLLLDWPDDDT